jgi:hypothetical protein
LSDSEPLSSEDIDTLKELSKLKDEEAVKAWLGGVPEESGEEEEES